MFLTIGANLRGDLAISSFVNKITPVYRNIEIVFNKLRIENKLFSIKPLNLCSWDIRKVILFRKSVAFFFAVKNKAGRNQLKPRPSASIRVCLRLIQIKKTPLEIIPQRRYRKNFRQSAIIVLQLLNFSWSYLATMDFLGFSTTVIKPGSNVKLWI